MRVSLFILALILSCGCIAIVDEQDKVTSFVITEAETRELIEKIDAKSPQEKREYRIFRSEESE